MGDVIPAKHERYTALKRISWYAPQEPNARAALVSQHGCSCAVKQGLQTCVRLPDLVLLNNSRFISGGDTQ